MYVFLSAYEAAVTTDNGILFFDSNWQKISSAAHQYTRLSAFAYDEVLGKLYFSDLNDPEYRVCALEYDDKEHVNHKVTKLLPYSPETTAIGGMAFDHLERKLYWTEKTTHKIYSIEIDPLLDGAALRNQGEANVTLPLPKIVATVEQDDDLAGIAIDECRRHLYWTNSYLQRSNIVRAAMNGTILNTHEEGVYQPRGITIDHYRNRLYWVEKRYGRRYNIESTDLEITNLTTLISDLDRNPVDLAVSNGFVYWTDQENNDIYETAKNSSQQTRSVYHGEHPSAVILRANLLIDHQKNNPDCTGVIESILEKMQKSKSSEELRKKQQASGQDQVIVCLNNGTLNPNTRSCICKPFYTGKFCETNVCQNFCLHGSCTMGRDNKPRCECESPYEGIRCDQKPCDGFCLNGGLCQSKSATERICQCDSTGFTGARCEKPICSKDYCFQGECVVDQNRQPTCRCPAGYRGKRCEENSCNDHCMNGGKCTLNNETVPECQCGDEFAGKRCEIPVRLCEHPQWKQQCLDTAKTLPQMEPKVTYCKESFNRTVVYTSLCFTVSFVLLLIIVLTVHRMMKPPRPRITKKMVVTPMTSRPPTTQCEITIENCCNMNVCETPCFDTKLLKNSPKKDDKVYLLEDIEDVGGSYRKLHNCDDGSEKFNGSSVRK
ncbi:AGAP007023-PA-like protein [Anopheles sinensis]|uniref:Protein cueball n=1 Tax=Anopheles sinensis TaxID=74873 RepID=A0A084W9Y3_ANOSI|nr:AGAP007023-PA-like protein [Anopheles sinensis]